MIAVDANILVYAHRSESPWHARAKELVGELASGSSPWAIPWPCIHEFLSAVTNPRMHRAPTPLEIAIDQVDAWLDSPQLTLIGEGSSHWQDLRDLAVRGRVVGPMIHDARIAAICISHGVRELWTADRDFGRFPALVTRNPLLDEG